MWIKVPEDHQWIVQYFLRSWGVTVGRSWESPEFKDEKAWCRSMSGEISDCKQAGGREMRENVSNLKGTPFRSGHGDCPQSTWP